MMWVTELTDEGKEALDRAVEAGVIKVSTRKETCIHVLRALISYHERMTMGDFPVKDFYVDTLRYAIQCVEAYDEK